METSHWEAAGGRLLQAADCGAVGVKEKKSERKAAGRSGERNSSRWRCGSSRHRCRDLLSFLSTAPVPGLYRVLCLI